MAGAAAQALLEHETFFDKTGDLAAAAVTRAHDVLRTLDFPLPDRLIRWPPVPPWR